MKICFPDQARRDLYNCRSNLVRLLGEEVARKVCCRLAVLKAASNLAEVPTHPPISRATTTAVGSYTLAVGKTHRLELRVLGGAKARSLPPDSVTEVEIVDVIKIPLAQGKRQ